MHMSFEALTTDRRKKLVVYWMLFLYNYTNNQHVVLNKSQENHISSISLWTEILTGEQTYRGTDKVMHTVSSIQKAPHCTLQ